MKLSRILATASMGLAMLPWAAQAQCQASTTTGIIQFQGNGNAPGTLRNLLQGNTVCGRPGPSYPGSVNDRWQEEHQGGPSSGDLWDYKLGNGNTVDGRKQVGTWAINNQIISHAYTVGPPFLWTVYGPQTNTPGVSVYSFCTGTSEFARAYVKAGINVGCGSSYP